jgi:2-haloalkanoic acid dehalogenase type II
LAELRAVIFDYYETLVEISTTQRQQAFDALAQRVGMALPAGEAFRHWRERTLRQALLHFVSGRRPPLDGTPGSFVSFHEDWLRRSAELFRHWGVVAPPELGASAYRDAHANAALYQDAAPAIDALRGRHKLAVLSDADNDFLLGGLERNRLAFDIVVSSEDVRAYKPHISMFHEVCAPLRVAPSEALYVGDSPWADVAGARHADLRAVWLNRHEATWPEDLEPPEARVTSLAELIEMLM